MQHLAPLPWRCEEFAKRKTELQHPEPQGKYTRPM